MERCARFHRFAVLVCAVVCVASGTRPSTQNLAARATPRVVVAARVSVAATEAGQQAKPALADTSQSSKYTLPQDRYKKAIAYSRAGYTLYFMKYFSKLLVLILILRLGVAAKFRDFAERVTGNRLVQGIVFIPVLLLTLSILDLPFRVDGHSLSLRYEQSVQRGGFVDVGLDEGSAAGGRICGDLGDDFICGDSPKPASMVAVLLDRVAPHHLRHHFCQPVVHRPTVQ